MVSKNPYLFLDDLLGLSTDRVIEFCIDLVLGAQPIFIPTYCMAIVEMTKLRK